MLKNYATVFLKCGHKMKFKEFISKSDRHDVNNVLQKLPKKHYNLIKDYKISFESGSTLKKDKKHIGFIDEEKKLIKIAAPWYYSREFTLLHEVAHSVWKYELSNKNKKEWKEIVKLSKDKQKSNITKEASKSLDQQEEEIFCMAYANYYSKHKILTYDNENYYKFIKNL